MESALLCDVASVFTSVAGEPTAYRPEDEGSALVEKAGTFL
jgi:hypothetical protein